MPDAGGMGPAGAPAPVSLGIPLADNILQGTAPLAVRLAAARGALPLTRPVLFRLLVSLCSDPDESVRSEADKNIREWPRPELQAMAEDTGTDAAILSHLIGVDDPDGSILAALLANDSTPRASIEEAASALPARRLDILLLNQTLLIEHPVLLEKIDANPNASPLHLARTAEIRRHFLGEEVPAAETAPAVPHPEPGSDAQPAVAPAGTGPDEAPAEEEIPEDASAAAAQPETAGEAEDEKAAKDPGVYARIMGLNITQKIALASKGTKEERGILIREANRSIQEAVINSPKLSIQEVESIAKMRNVNEEILRAITRKRDWMKSYAIVHALANNPKTPIGVSMSLLTRLTTKDLKMMTRDKNVPETLRRIVRKHMENRANKAAR